MKKIVILSKNATIRDIKMIKNQSINTKNYAVLNYQTSREIAWPLKLEKLKKMTKIFKNLEKMAKISIILRVCVCSTNPYSS